MNYSKFFAILSNQCARFAPNSMVPDEFEEALSHVQLASVLGEVDRQLLETLQPLLAPKFRAALAEANNEVKGAVGARLAEMEEARKAAHAERLATIERAQQLELQRAQENERIKADMAEAQNKILQLEEAIQKLQSLK